MQKPVGLMEKSRQEWRDLWNITDLGDGWGIGFREWKELKSILNFWLAYCIHAVIITKMEKYMNEKSNWLEIRGLEREILSLNQLASGIPIWKCPLASWIHSSWFQERGWDWKWRSEPHLLTNDTWSCGIRRPPRETAQSKRSRTIRGALGRPVLRANHRRRDIKGMVGEDGRWNWTSS